MADRQCGDRRDLGERNGPGPRRAAPDTLALAWTLDLRDLCALAPGWTGRVQAEGGLAGNPAAPDLVADLTADAAYAGAGAGQTRGRLQASLAAPTGSLALTGDWAGLPLAIDLSARRDPDGALHLALGDSRLAGVAAAGAAWPSGKVHLQARRLEDLAPLVAPWTGPGLTGRLDADLSLDTEEVRLVARGEGLGFSAGMGIGSLALEARVMDPLASPRTDATLRLRQVVAGAIGGDLVMIAEGPLTALDLTTVASLTGPRGSLGLDLAGRLDGPARRLALSRLQARSMGETLNLTAPAVLDLGEGLAVDRLRLGLGEGTIEIAGRLAPRLDLNATVARDARPVQRDDLALTTDADPSLRGRLPDAATLAGAIHVKRLEIHLPERLPAAVATLEVRERGGGRTPQPSMPPRAPPDLGPDLTLAAPRAVYVRGRGFDVDLGGEVRLAGTLANPVIAGGFNLLRGRYDLIGQTINFSRGRIGFDGATGLDPTLDLEARVAAAGSTAILAVLGTATAPRIELRGEPEIPQDEVLSRLLFGVAGGRLSPLQAARLGVAAASLAGVGGGGPGLLDRVRSGLGLDRLSLGSGEGTLEGGRQLDDRIYLGARQGPRSGEPQAVLRIEISPRIRLEADVGPTGGTRAGGAYEIEY